MSIIHRHDDLRQCGASTIASQSTVTASNKAIATVGDVSSHGSSAFLEPANRKISIGGKSIIAVGDLAQSDNQSHISPNTRANTGISTISIG